MKSFAQVSMAPTAFSTRESLQLQNGVLLKGIWHKMGWFCYKSIFLQNLHQQ